MESVISVHEFCYVKIWFDAYTWQSMNTVNLIVGDVMTSWCWNENWCVIIELKIVSYYDFSILRYWMHTLKKYYFS